MHFMGVLLNLDTFQKILCGSLQSLLDISDPVFASPLVKAKSEFSLILSPVPNHNNMSSSSM